MGYNYAYIRSDGQSDVGRVRQHNEDSIGYNNQQGWFAVADGMGGEEAGEVASAQVITSLKDEFSSMPDQEGVDNLHTKQALIERGLTKANHAIRSYVAQQGLKQSGSTAALMAFDFCQPDRALVAHVGDSRVYRMRRGSLEQITVDHSVAAAAGLSNEDDIPAMFRGMVTRAIGIKEEVEPEFQVTEIEVGDVFLICSDGLSGMINDRKIAKRIRHVDPDALPDVAARLIADANAGGGKDNISVILIYVGESDMFAPDRDQLTRLVMPRETDAGPDPLADPDSGDTVFTAPIRKPQETSETQLTDDGGLPTLQTATAPMAPTPPSATRPRETVENDAPATATSPVTESPRASHFLKDKLYIILFGIAVVALLAYMIYIGFIKQAPEIDTGAFPKALDDASVLSQLSRDAALVPTPGPAAPRIDLSDGSAIENAIRSGEWHVIRDAIRAGAAVPEGARLDQAMHWIGLWEQFREAPEAHYAAYTNFHHRLLATGETDLFSAHYKLSEPIEDPDEHASALCQFTARFDQQVAPMLDAFAMRISDLIGLVDFEEQPILPELLKTYDLPASDLNTLGIRVQLPPLKQLRADVTELAARMRTTGSSPGAVAAIDFTPFETYSQACTAWINDLNRALDEHAQHDLKGMISEMPESIRSVGQNLLADVNRAQTNLDAARGAHNGPLALADVEMLLPLYQKFYQSILAFNAWHAPPTEIPEP